MTRGGKRNGAGRPKGEPTVMIQRRVKPEWIPLIDKFIKDLRAKKALLILFCMFALALPCFALTLEGGVEYTEETAREAAFEGVNKYYGYSNTDTFNRSLFIASINYDDVQKVIEYKAKYKGLPLKLTGIIYKDEPNTVYVYKKQQNGFKGTCIIAYKDINSNTTKSANYDTQSGKLISVGLITDGEEYKYDVNGKLLGHWTGTQLKSADKRVNAALSILYDCP